MVCIVKGIVGTFLESGDEARRPRLTGLVVKEAGSGNPAYKEGVFAIKCILGYN